MPFKYSKVRDVKSPCRAHEGDAGIDFFIPNDYKVTIEETRQTSAFDTSLICIPPHSRINIPSGIKVNIPFGYCLIAFNKSGLAAKQGLDVLACIIDHGYTGEVHLSVVNTGNDIAYVKAGDKLVQFIYFPVIMNSPVEVKPEELYEDKSERGDGGFGSTGK